MRCLRCALDYPPEERYCHRCGRALSRPPGSKDPEERSQYSTLQDTQYLYTTHSPPSTEGADQARESQEEQAHGIAPTPRAGLLSSSLARHASGSRGEEVSDYGALGETAQAAVDEHPAPPSPTGGIIIAPPTEETWHNQPQVKLTRPVDDFDDDEDVLAAFRVKPTSIGADSGSRRRRATQQRGMTVLPQLPRQARLAILALVVLLIGGGVAIWRHSTYASDLQSGRRYAQEGQYPAAINSIQQAIDAWPLNSDAKNELAAVQATVTIANATATAVVVNAQAQATAVVERRRIYAARLQQREQSAAQADANAIATATALASH